MKKSSSRKKQKSKKETKEKNDRGKSEERIDEEQPEDALSDVGHNGTEDESVPQKNKNNKKTKVEVAEIKKDESEAESEDESDKDEAAEEYEVQNIMDQKVEKGVTYYLIRWKGYGADGDTWEPKDTLSCPDLIEKFHKKNKRSSKVEETLPKKKAKGKETADPEKEWEVEKIIDMGYEKGSRVFRIRWKGYRPNQDTWEPEEHLNCKDLIEQFMAKVEARKDAPQKELREAPRQTKRLINEAAPPSGSRKSRRHQGKTRTLYYDTEE